MSHLDLLSTHIKTISFQDAKNSSRDPCLIGLPSLEFAPYNKVPTGRARHDGRQGTIDQDPEFIDFLQSLTEPITKAAANGDPEAKQDKVTTTPLVQYIKEKKANKAKEKEVAAAKAGKKADNKDAKGSTPSKSEQQPVVKKSTTSEAEKARVAKATQDVVKAINTLSKSAATQQSKAAPAKQDTPAKESVTPAQSTPKRERQRGDANAAARIISRDLGLTPKESRSTKGSRAVSTPASTPSTPTSTTPAAKGPTAPAPSTSKSPAQPPPQPPIGPRSQRNATPQPSPLRPSPVAPVQSPAPKTNTKPLPQPTSGAKSAFLKHANPSQGITEELLRTTFSVYGTITRCEIDKKKGLGYLDFTETEGLKKAMAASPVKIANGSVIVLENRSPYRKASQSAAQTKGNAAAASASTSVASSPKVTHAALTSISESIPIQPKSSEAAVVESSVGSTPPPSTETVSAPEPSEKPSTPASPTTTATPAQIQTPPSAPRGSGGGRSGRGHHRGRGGFRGRGGYRGGNRAASTATANGSSAPSTPTASAPDNKG